MTARSAQPRPIALVARHHGRRRRRRRGAIFITALGVLLVLSGLLLVFATSMRTEGLASANRASYAQADAVEQGAERWVLAQVESYPGDAVTVSQVPAAALQVGNGYFWVLQFDPTQDQNYVYGITDECSKLNINSASSDQMLYLPNVTSEVADSVVDWRDADSTPGPNGAESDYYQSLPEPYEAKNAPFETVEEMLLVKNVTPDVLFGYDKNRDGVIDPVERNAGGAATMFNSSTSDGRGLFNFVTCYTVNPNTDATGARRININNLDSENGLQKALTAAIPDAGRVTTLVANWRLLIRQAGNGNRAFANIGEFQSKLALTIPEFKLIVDKISNGGRTTLTGRINVNTASKQVLQCLPNITESDAESLVAKRGGVDTSSIAWIFDVLSMDKAGPVAARLTARSYQYSADIVAVSGDGRAFKRVRIVVDAQQIPAKIVYRKDLTSYGWPLPPDVRTSLRHGQGIPPDGAGTGLSGVFGSGR